MIKLGAQYFTIRDYCKTIEEFDCSCKKIRDIGYKCVQLSGIGDFSANEIKPIVDKYGLDVVCTHRAPQNYLEDIEEEIDFHKTLNCKICGIGSMPHIFEPKNRSEVLDEFIKNFTPVIKRLQEEDLIFAYHNHSIEFEKIDGKYIFDLLKERIPLDNFKFILDIYWLAYAGINPAEFIEKNKDRIACVHFKDLKIVNNTAQFSEVGEGNLDWNEIISTCKKCDIELVLVEQDDYWRDDDPFKSLAMSYDFIKRIEK